MNKREIAVLSFKVLSFYAFIQAIGKMSDIIYQIFEGTHDETFVMNILLKSIPLILLVFSGIILWYVAPPLANNIFKAPIHEDKTEASSIDIPMIAFSVVGLCLLSTALTNVADFIILLLSFLGTPIAETKTILIYNTFVFLLKVVFGLWLLFDSRRIVKYVYRGKGDASKKDEIGGLA